MADTPDKFTVTMKSHAGHDATWVVVKANSQTELVDLLSGFSQSGVSALVGEAVSALRAEETLGALLGARPVEHPGQYDQAPQNAPQGGYQAPQGGYQAPPSAPPAATPYGPAPTCPHGTKRFIEKPYKNKPGTWRAWTCPAPQGTPDQCSLEFIK
ncbi:hypothetical protein RM863_11800 [Streptomyces sp. DSM 41014]|uniref:Uncharacterized protein n=1 Tax=Streptomyces hintoniae TaxID=3075521 RepID=A0ABU2UHR0_9ACTN|nr:hypothetical protein [Streptomyces sp. DSM 41014]MDT0472808.1 hypothetical protein [Streptomyces sp. DSM 41014]